MESRSRIPSTGPAPGTSQEQATGVDVVGLRMPVWESRVPARALKSEDLPLPVAPAIATAVYARGSRSRAPAASSTR